ncbi:ankyrin repeat domain-containing protein [Gemmatimonadota bacterium]
MYGKLIVSIVLLTLLAGFTVCTKGKNERFIEAASKGQTETIRALLQEGADVNAQNHLGSTALMVAAEAGHTETVLALIKSGADINAKNYDGFTALIYASCFGHTETILA